MAPRPGSIRPLPPRMEAGGPSRDSLNRRRSCSQFGALRKGGEPDECGPPEGCRESRVELAIGGVTRPRPRPALGEPRRVESSDLARSPLGPPRPSGRPGKERKTGLRGVSGDPDPRSNVEFGAERSAWLGAGRIIRGMSERLPGEGRTIRDGSDRSVGVGTGRTMRGVMERSVTEGEGRTIRGISDRSERLGLGRTMREKSGRAIDDGPDRSFPPILVGGPDGLVGREIAGGVGRAMGDRGSGRGGAERPK